MIIYIKLIWKQFPRHLISGKNWNIFGFVFVNCIRKTDDYEKTKAKYSESINWHSHRCNSRLCLKPGICRLRFTVNVNV